MIGAVVFDVGECLVNETREYGTWADWLGVPRHVFSAVFGAVIARPGLPGDLPGLVFPSFSGRDGVRDLQGERSGWVGQVRLGVARESGLRVIA